VSCCRWPGRRMLRPPRALRRATTWVLTQAISCRISDGVGSSRRRSPQCSAIRVRFGFELSPVLSTRSVAPRNQAFGRREAPGTNGACLLSGSRPETALRSDPGATTTVTRGGIGGDATFWPAQGVPFVCQALTFPQVRAWQPDTRCGWETHWAGLPGVCSRLIDLAERGECLPCESQRRG